MYVGRRARKVPEKEEQTLARSSVVGAMQAKKDARKERHSQVRPGEEGGGG